MAETIVELLSFAASRNPQAATLADGVRSPLTYAGLLALLDQTAARLADLGFAAEDRVAIVLPNGPELAAAFLAVAHAAVAAPLNPAYRQAEFEFYLSDLRAAALIVAANENGPAVAAARATGTAVLDLAADKETAGLFRLTPRGLGPVREPVAGRTTTTAEQTALVLHTSGTTARPKIVPLSQANLCHSAQSIAHSLKLTPADRCLNVMPLFHIHGLVGAVLATLASGGCVHCAPGFDAGRFLDELERVAPTWYTAAPTIHQAALTAVAQRGGQVLAQLRFVRSCSSPLPPSVMQRLEDVFRAPVVEAYGMTEAAHQMACNPLPPGARKPGSVGVATGLEIAIMDESGRLLPACQIGEVVIRGPNVTSGYEARPEANAACFTQGWFRTGDQGRLDAEGYLYLTGRIKEIINRGGEKISPREIDDVLLAHPAVAQALTFAIPHPSLGEEIAAALVLRPGTQLSAAEVQAHVATSLATFKAPQKVLFVPEIPKGPTGKPQRIGMADRLGLTSPTSVFAAADDAPRSDTERHLAVVWQQLLDKPIGSRRTGFFDAGGDSLLATMLLTMIEKRFEVAISPGTLFQDSTLAGLAAAIDRSPRGAAPDRKYEYLVPFQTAGDAPAMYLVHGHSGRSLSLGLIAAHLDRDQPYYGFVARGMDGRRLPRRRLPEIAADYLGEVRQAQPRGPYCLGGFCAGGAIAYEMAQQLLKAGEEVDLLVMIDATHSRLYTPTPRLTQTLRNLKLTLRRGLFRLLEATRGRGTVKLGERIVNETLRTAAETYRPRPYQGTLTLLRSETHQRTEQHDLGWTGVAAQVDVRSVPVDHRVIFTSGQIIHVARALQTLLREVYARREVTRRAA